MKLMTVVGYPIEFTEGKTGSLKNNYGSKSPSKGVRKNNVGNSDGLGVSPSQGGSKNRGAGSDKHSKGVKRIDYRISNARR